MAHLKIEPSIETVRELLEKASKLPNAPNLVPLSVSLSSEFQTPASLYLKLTAKWVVHSWLVIKARLTELWQIKVEIIVFIRKRSDDRDNWPV
jgi:hypothetical protein